MKRIFSVLLLLALVLSLSVLALADEIGLVEYRKKGFTFLPGYQQGELNYPTDLFPELKDVMPGDVLHQQVKIVHKGSSAVNIVLYIKAEGSSENEDFIRQMQLDVAYRDKNILYSKDATQESGWTRLGTLAPGKSAALDLTLTVPAEMGNDFANTWGTVVWKFKVEEIPVDPTAPKTFDGSNLLLWGTVLSLSGLFILLLARKKKK